MVNMANTRIMRVARETRSQEAKMMLKKALRLEMRIKFVYGCDEVELVKVVEIASSNLQDYIFENFLHGVKEWNKILEQLRKEEKYETERNERVEILERTYEEVLKEWREKQREETYRLYKIRKNARLNAKCFICQRVGHMARGCRERVKDERKDCRNDGECIKIEESGEKKNVNDEEAVVRRDNKRFKPINKFNLLVEKYPEMLGEKQKKIVFMTGEKCVIKTKAGEKVIKKGQNVPYYLREKLKDYLEDLIKRGVIRRSTSEWRNPIRALEKPDGGIRLVSNLWR